MTACDHIGLDPPYQRQEHLLWVNEGQLAQNPRKNSHPTQQAAFNTHKPCPSQPFPMHHREEEERGEGFLTEDILIGLAFSFPFALTAFNSPILHSTCTRQGSARLYVTGSTASFLTPTWGGEQFPAVLFRGNLKISESGSQRRCSRGTHSQATPSGNLPEQGKPYSC